MLAAPKTHPFEVFVGSLNTMASVAASGVKALNPRTHKWQIISKSASYLVVKDFEVADDESGEKHWCGSLFCDQDLRAIAEQKGLII